MNRGLFGHPLGAKVPSARVAAVSFVLHLANGSNTIQTFDTVRWDNDQMFNPSLPQRLSCHTPGLYAIRFTASFTANATGVRDITIGILSPDDQVGQTIGQTLINSGQASFVTVISCESEWQMKANDYVQISLFVNTTSIDSINAPPYAPELAMTRIG